MGNFVSNAVIAAGMATALTVGAQQPSVVYRAPVDTVPVFATVTDASNQLVSDLTREDFQIRDNGAERMISVFDSASRPLRLAVMLDVSGSMYPNVGLLRGACEELFARLRTDDMVRLGTFGHEVTISDTFTSERDALRAALPTTISRSALTPLWLALDKAISALDSANSRPVVVVLSDGKDSGTRPGETRIGLDSVIARANREGIMVYAIGLHSRGGTVALTGAAPTMFVRDDRPDPGLRTLALQTGGRYFEVDLNPERDLGAAFASAMDELHNQYLLGFAAARDGAVHQIDVSVTRPGLTVRARRSYVAPTGE